MAFALQATTSAFTSNAVRRAPRSSAPRTARINVGSARLVVRASEKIDEVENMPVYDKGQKNSYERIEAPVRGGEQQPGKIPDGGPPVGERNNSLDNFLIQNQGSAEKSILGDEVAFPDAMRFKGAAPEVINCRLAMLGFVAAAGAELATGRPVWEQFAIAPVPIVATFFTIIVASLVPILRGVQRRGGKDWGGLAAFTPDAELINGRLAMIGFVGLILGDVIARR